MTINNKVIAQKLTAVSLDKIAWFFSIRYWLRLGADGPTPIPRSRLENDFDITACTVLVDGHGPCSLFDVLFILKCLNDAFGAIRKYGTKELDGVCFSGFTIS